MKRSYHSYSGQSAGGFGIACGLLTYLLGIVGFLIMLFTAPFAYVWPALVLVLVLISPVPVRLARGATAGEALSACAEYGHYIFTLLVAMWWVLFSTHTAGPGALIAIGVMSMYAMYYFPCFLALDASARGLSGGRCAWAAIICFVDSLIFFAVISAVIGDRMSEYGNVMFSTAIVVSGNLQHAVNKYREAKKNGNGLRGLISVVLVFTIAAGSIASVMFLLPKTTENRYNRALALIEEGKYREARWVLSDIATYPAAAEKLAEIAFVNLEVGESVTIGHMQKHMDKPGRDYALTWTVLDVKDGKALLLCDEILLFQNSNSFSMWNEGNNVRGRLEGIYDGFDDADKAHILLSKMTTSTEKGPLTAEDYLFLLSQEELQTYCTNEKMLYTKDASSYYMSQGPNFDTVICYYTRTVNEKGEWIVADCDNRTFTTRKDSTYLFTGIRPAMYVNCPASLAD